VRERKKPRGDQPNEPDRQAENVRQNNGQSRNRTPKQRLEKANTKHETLAGQRPSELARAITLSRDQQFLLPIVRWP
jgi:hypothetical protein